MPTTLGMVGVGVSNMSRSIHYYTQILPLNLKVTQKFDVPAFLETVLSLPVATSASGKKISPGSQIILMQYKDGRKPDRQQGKLVFNVDDVEACMKKCKEYGSEVYKEPSPSGGDWTSGIGIVRDPDGFLVEFIPVSSLKASFGSGKEAKL